jgi:hypothetical protein
MQNANTGDGKKKMMSDVTIYGRNADSLAAILEYIQLPEHPGYEHAKAEALQFIESYRMEKRALCQQVMVDQMLHISDEEWSSIVH